MDCIFEKNRKNDRKSLTFKDLMLIIDKLSENRGRKNYISERNLAKSEKVLDNSGRMQ